MAFAFTECPSGAYDDDEPEHRAYTYDIAEEELDDDNVVGLCAFAAPIWCPIQTHRHGPFGRRKPAPARGHRGRFSTVQRMAQAGCGASTGPAMHGTGRCTSHMADESQSQPYIPHTVVWGKAMEGR
eukprot:COSAG05_NODE_319_length_11483_cov_406.525604_11_plen_127_part_00